MILTRLPRISRNDLLGRQRQRYWRQRGYDSRLSTLPAQGLLIKFRMNTGWCGVIDLRRWFAAVYPGNAVFAHHAWPPERLVQLFISHEQPLTGLPEELAYQRVSEAKLDSNTKTSFYNSLLIPEGTLWVTESKEISLPGEINAAHIPLLIAWGLGYSVLDMKTLRTASPGDVLLIACEEKFFTLGGKKTGKYSRQNEAIMINEVNSEDLMDENEDVKQTNVLPRDHIPVKVTFILDQRLITLSEIEELYRGAVVRCPVDAENNIVMMANGIKVATGKLVDYEGQLGVEIVDIHQGKGDGNIK